MSGWGTFFLFVHILAVVIAFGPTFTFPLIGALSGKHPQYAMILTEASELIEKRLVIPLAIVVPLAGTGLIYANHIDMWKTGWLVAAIVIYIFVFFYAILVQAPNVAKLLGILKNMPAPPAGGPPAAAGEGGTPAGPPPGAGGPPPQVAALVKRIQVGGIALTVGFLVIMFLMIWGTNSWGVTFTGSLMIPSAFGLRIRRERSA